MQSSRYINAAGVSALILAAFSVTLLVRERRVANDLEELRIVARDDKSNLEEKLQKQLRERDIINGELAKLQNRVSESADEITSLTQRSNDLENQIVRINEGKAAVEQELQNWKGKYNDLNETRTDVEIQYALLVKESNEKNQEQEASLLSLRAALQEAEELSLMYKSQNEEFTGDIEELKLQNTKSIGEIESCKQNVSQLELKLVDMETRLLVTPEKVEEKSKKENAEVIEKENVDIEEENDYNDKEDNEELNKDDDQESKNKQDKEEEPEKKDLLNKVEEIPQDKANKEINEDLVGVENDIQEEQE